ncbi:MAG: WXG100 family type VII secretion target [Lachnospiraceae bacterium]|nr:WXG100 family type VII secretion target [Lachnospiraceae bacterium]
MKIKVNTEVLRSAADSIDARTAAVMYAVDDLRTVIDRSATYWEGAGQDAHVSAYRQKLEKVEQAIARYRENAQDLRKEAGIYESAERINTQISGMLTGDVLF